jgi:type II secretory pathway pseudopilin PulG
MMRARSDVGETLIEIVLAIFIIGLTVTALLAGLATAGNAGNFQRISVQADTYIRNYADATKAAVQQWCVDGATAYTVTYQAPVASGFQLTGAGSACPTTIAIAKPLTLNVTGPRGFLESVDIKVRIP